jgi:putative NIF3 family GTP cyclohydrolase 1 type 2
MKLRPHLLLPVLLARGSAAGRALRSSALLSVAGCTLLASSAPAAELTAQQVIARMQQNSGIPWKGPTVDTFKDGDPATPVKGIAVTMMATFDVLQRAAAQGCNLVITHEPTFWGHLDSYEPMASENDAVLQAKRDFIKAHNMVIFRFHDHIHQMKPDMIVTGVIKALDWQKFQSPDSNLKYILPETTLGELAADIQKRLGSRTLRVTGDPSVKVSKIGFSPGFSGFDRNRKLLQDPDVDVLMYGEAHEWETIEYAVDAITAGKKKGLITMGHIPSEEAGMKECAEWMKTFVPEVPIHFVSTPEPFWLPDAK